MNGKIALTEQLISGNNQIDISSLAEGVYCIHIGRMKPERLVISHYVDLILNGTWNSLTQFSAFSFRNICPDQELDF